MLRIEIYYSWTQSQRVRAREFETWPSAAFRSFLKVTMIMSLIQQVLIVILIPFKEKNCLDKNVCSFKAGSQTSF